MRAEDIQYLFSLNNEHRSIRYDIGNMRSFAAALGNPQESFDSVLIAGTNGKGSVGSMLSAMMPEAGFYTSPHLVRLNERIRIGNQEIDDYDLQFVFDQARHASANTPNLLYSPTYFEMVTAMAFLYFRNRVHTAVLEVGLGGRLDATNVVSQKVSVITSIGLDHQQFLGSTLQEIAAEKAGIIKGYEPVVVGHDVDFDIIRERAGSNFITTKDVAILERSLGDGFFEIDADTPLRQYRKLRPALRGRHQIQNAVVAIRTAECLGLNEAEIRRGIETTRWPGRLERFNGQPAFLLDGAHNPHAARALEAHLREVFPNGVWMIFGAMSDKDGDRMVEMLDPQVRQWIFTRPDSPRAADPGRLAQLVRNPVVTAGIREAIDYSRSKAPGDTTVVISGSLYLIGEARVVLE